MSVIIASHPAIELRISHSLIHSSYRKVRNITCPDPRVGFAVIELCEHFDRIRELA